MLSYSCRCLCFCKPFLYSVVILSPLQAHVQYLWLDILLPISNYLGLYFFWVTSIWLYSCPITIHESNLFIEESADESLKKSKSKLYNYIAKHSKTRKCKILKLPYGLELPSLYIFIVILSSVTKSTIIFSAGNMFHWGYEINVKGQNYAYILKCRWILVIWLYNLYDIDLIRGFFLWLIIQNAPSV